MSFKKVSTLLLALILTAGSVLQTPAGAKAMEETGGSAAFSQDQQAEAEDSVSEDIFEAGENISKEKALDYTVGSELPIEFTDRDNKQELYWKFTLPDSEILHMNLSYTKKDGYTWNKHTRVRILDDTGAEIYYLNCEAGTPSDLYMGLLKGTYYICAMNHQNIGTSTSSGTLTTQITCEDKTRNFQTVVEAYSDSASRNNTKGAASTVSAGTTVNGILGFNNLVDYYKFTLSGKGKVRVICNTFAKTHLKTSGNGFQVYDEKMEKRYMYEGGKSNNGIAESDDLPAGTYYVFCDETENTDLVASYQIVIEGKAGGDDPQPVPSPDPVVGMYKIRYYKVDGADNSMNPVSYSDGDTVTLKAPTRDGYEFKGWYKKYKKKKYKNPTTGIVASDKGDKKFYAKWKIVKYTITYDPDGGKNSKKNKKSFTITTKTFKLKNPKKKGHRFDGWFDKDGNRVYEIRKGTTGNIALTARWSPK